MLLDISGASFSKAYNSSKYEMDDNSRSYSADDLNMGDDMDQEASDFEEQMLAAESSSFSEYVLITLS